jgi:hypothetical protein
MMKKISLLVAAALTVVSAPLSAQSSGPQVAPAAHAPNARHLVVLNKEGPNFARRVDHRAEMLQHRQVYLDLTAEGEIIASGTIDFEPRIGFVLFREGINEAAIRARLENDFAIKEGILELEYRYWSIQMGGLEPVSAARLVERK